MGSLSNSNTSKMGKSNSTDDQVENVWSQILTDVRSNASIKLPSGKSVILLGDSESGKTTLVAKLQGIEDPKKGCGLEYAYIEIRDEYRDDSTQLSVWVLDGNPSHKDLLKFALSEKNFSESLIMLTVSLTTPWSVLDQLQFWAGVLLDHIDSLKMSPDKIRELREKSTRRWADYLEPGDEMDIATSSSSNSNQREGRKDSFEEKELPPNTLVRNTGLDIVVVLTKTDHIGNLERDNEYRDEHFDFIQYHIRQFCVQYGAALFYTSVKEDKNCDLLYKYLVHRIYGLPFRTPALIVEKDAVFIPAGWDNDKKMAILHENMTSFKPDDFYNEVIAKPITTRKSVGNRETEFEVEDEQKFLQRQLGLLQMQSNISKDPKIAVSPRTPDKSPRAITSSPKSTVPKPDQAKSETVLANFFNSLLSKKSSGASPSTPPKTNYDSRNDAAAELERLMKKEDINYSLNSSSDC